MLRLESLEQRTLLSGGRPNPPGNPGDNIALNCPYTVNEPANYPGCTDPNGTLLTDGQYSTGGGLFWNQATTVGWQNEPTPVQITIDLGQVQPIQGASLDTAGGIDGVQWPTAINIQVSNDGVNFYGAGNLVALAAAPPAYGTYAVHQYTTASGLGTGDTGTAGGTYGRYIRFQVVASPDVFVDEIQVFRGSNAMLGQNIALGQPYSLSPAPNYANCNGPNYATQLTDGQYTQGNFWTQPTTDGWATSGSQPWAQITIDLGSDQPIEGVSYDTAACPSVGVTWPSNIFVLASTDGVNYYQVGELVTLGAAHGVPPASGYAVFDYWTDSLATHGRYVSLVADSSPYIFTDEIEVYRGHSEMLGQSYTGAPITNVGTLIADAPPHFQGGVQIATDASSLLTQVQAAAQLTTTQRTALSDELTGYMVQGMTDNPPQVVLPMDNLDSQVFQVQAALWQDQGLANLTAWMTASQWDQLSPLESPLGQTAAGVDVTLMQDEFRSAAFCLSNATGSDQDLSLAFTGLPGGAQPNYVTVQEAQWTSTASGTEVAQALTPVSYNAAQQAFIVDVPAGMTRQVWLTFNPTTTNPGTYAGTIVVSGAGVNTVNVPVQLQISSQVFPAQTTLGLGGWDYTDTTYGQVTSGNIDAFVATLQAHFVNTPWATAGVMPASVDFTQFDAWVARWPNAQQYDIFLNVGTTFAGYQMGTTAFNQAVGAWMSAYAAHWQQLGITPGQIGLLLVDEPQTTAQADMVIDWAQAIKAAVPGVQIWEDPIFANPADGQAMYSVCDTLCLNYSMFLTYGSIYQDYYLQERNAGKTLEFYNDLGPTDQLDPYSYYMMEAWSSWSVWGSAESGPTAIFYWSFADQGGLSSWESTAAHNTVFTPLFLTPTSVTDGIDMEAVREGVEDYQYLDMLKSRITALQNAGVAASLLSAAESLLASAPATVLDAANATDGTWTDAKDRTTADTVRIEILDMLEQLAAPVISPAHIQVSGATGSGGAYRVGDVVTATWNATAAGDYNPTPPLAATVDFTQFGGSSAVVATDAAGVWTAQYTITAGSINGAMANVAITAINNYGITAATGTNNVTVDDAPPTLSALAPADNATGVPPAGSLVLTFSESVQAAPAGNVVIWRAADNALIQSIAASSSQVTVSGSTVTVTPASPLPVDTTYYVLVDAGAFQDLAGNAYAGISSPTAWRFTTTYATVAGRYLFYNNSSYNGNSSTASAADDAAIDTSKQPLLPGQTSTYANYTDSSQGINGIMVDISGLANPGQLSAADFQFLVGNDSTPSDWTALTTAPTVTVRGGAGTGGSDRVELTWPDNTIHNQWLQITVLADAHTGLAANDVFYFGNEPGAVLGQGYASFDDIFAVYRAIGHTPSITPETAVDVTHDGMVTFDDMFAVYRAIGGAILNTITVPATTASVATASVATADASDAASASAPAATLDAAAAVASTATASAPAAAAAAAPVAAASPSETADAIPAAATVPPAVVSAAVVTDEPSLTAAPAIAVAPPLAVAAAVAPTALPDASATVAAAVIPDTAGPVIVSPVAAGPEAASPSSTPAAAVSVAPVATGPGLSPAYPPTNFWALDYALAGTSQWCGASGDNLLDDDL